MRRDRRLYIRIMRIVHLAFALPLIAGPAMGQTFNEERATNALRDGARAQERQARSLERQEGLLREQALQDDRDRRNAARDARSSRRFDRQ